MNERMTAADAAPLHRERSTAPQHVGGLAVFVPPAAGLDYERLVRLLEERISLAPRYRQKIRMVPGHLSTPVWVDDPAFDVTYHVRRSALPRPGTDQQLLEFCARIQARRLDRSRPLWEMYLVEGLVDGRIAIITKTHEAMVDEHGGIDLWQVILDAAAEPRRTVQAVWMPGPEPSTASVVRAALVDVVRHPLGLTDTARATARDARHTLRRATRLMSGATTATGALLRRDRPSPLQAVLSEQRRLAIARTRLTNYRAVRATFGGTVNDVALAVVTGALRGWLLSRSEPLESATTVRALVPVSVASVVGAGGGVAVDGGPSSLAADLDAEDAHHVASPDPSAVPTGSAESRVLPFLVDLPVGEPDPVLRLTQLRYAMASLAASGHAVGAETLAALNGFAPPTLHALGARAATGLTRRMFSLVITNVPGPQVPLYAAGARMTEMFPILPLSPGQAVSIAMTSYDGGIFYGVNADRDAVRDVNLLAELLEESLAELVSAADAAAGASRRGSQRT